MVARTSTWAGSPEALDKWQEHVKAHVSGFVAGLPGNAGGAFLLDREAGKALTLTLWESEEAAAETDKFADHKAERAPSRRQVSSWSIAAPTRS